MKIPLLTGLGALWAFASNAALVSFIPSLDIPDGNASGLADVQAVNVPIAAITDLNVTLNLVSTGLGGFNGDIYATLTHDGGFSVLLNRPGKRDDSLLGYADAGINITLDDQAGADVHVYRLSLNGSHTTPLGGALTGSWQPDARLADPASVNISSPRTSPLSVFDGVNPNGTWTLFVADLASGGEMKLSSWGMDITGTAVPEPESLAAAALGCLGVAAFLRCHRKNRRPKCP